MQVRAQAMEHRLPHLPCLAATQSHHLRRSLAEVEQRLTTQQLLTLTAPTQLMQDA